jgi:predicted transcriptional regulator
VAFPVEQLMKKRLSCSDIVKCAFDLGDQEIRVYDVLNDLGPSKVEDVAAVVDRDASVVYRHLRKLHGCGIVEKEKRALPEGGYFYSYTAVPRSRVKKELNACVDDWYAQMKAAIRRL